MREQNYQNHVRLHPAFHFVLMPMVLIVFVGAVFNLFPRFRGGMELWFAIIVLLGSIALMLAAMMTRQYANKVQDRVVRAEENFRAYRLTGHPLDPRLTLSQIIALRFASDEEYADLTQRAINEKLSSDAIKKAIQHWNADNLRV